MSANGSLFKFFRGDGDFDDLHVDGVGRGVGEDAEGRGGGLVAAEDATLPFEAV